MTDKLTNLPFHDNFNVTAIYGEEGPMWSLGFHTGIDLVAVTNKTVYSTCNGTVYSKGFSNSYGYNVFIQDNEKGYYHHFCHLANESPLQVGQTVDRNTIVGQMGATGNVTGPHLHFELMKGSTQFLAENFLNPCEWLKIPNEEGFYNWQDYPIDEQLEPPDPPVSKKKKSHFKFVLFKKKFY